MKVEDLKAEMFPVIDHLPDDPELEKVEAAFTQHATRNLSPFEESEDLSGQVPAGNPVPTDKAAKG